MTLPSDLSAELIEAMRYAVLGGGKRLRPLFLCATTSALGGSVEKALTSACAVELIHSYSLVHDDLPAMDDDDVRHGKPATHIVFGEANGILAGDGLLTYAFELIAGDKTLTAEVRSELVLLLAQAAGPTGMVGGQALDMRLESAAEVRVETLQAMHRAKSGALIKAAVLMGGTIAGAVAVQKEQLARFADDVGLAFQVIDDVLDATRSTEQLGKPAGSDVAQNKQTFVTLLGVTQARKVADELLSAAQHALDALGLKESLLADVAAAAVNRDA